MESVVNWFFQVKWNTTKTNAEQRKMRMVTLVPQVNNFKKQVQNVSAVLSDLEVKAQRINGDEQKRKVGQIYVLK